MKQDGLKVTYHVKLHIGAVVLSVDFICGT